MFNLFITKLPHPYNNIGDGPEGVEITITYEQLNALINNTKLIDIQCNSNKKCPKSLNLLKKQLPINLYKVGVRGKNIYIIIKNNKQWFCIWFSFAMTGKFTFNKTKHTKLSFTFKGNKLLKSGKTMTGYKENNNNYYYTPIDNFIIPQQFNNKKTFILYFESVRGFSKVELLTNKLQLKEKLNNLQHSFLQDSEDKLTIDEFNNTLQKYNKRYLCAVLLDAHIFTGIGNYILAEVLYKSRISPFRKIYQLNNQEIKKLYHSIKYIMKWSYLSQEGLNHNIFKSIKIPSKLFTFAVYRQKKDPKGNKVISQKIPSGRTGHWVKQLQI